MPHLMKLPDGSDELFFSCSDLLALIREKLGPDVESEIRDILEESKDLSRSCEETCEDNQKAFVSLRNLLGTVNTALGDLSKLTEQMQDILENQ